MRPLDVSFAMFEVSAATVINLPISPVLLKTVFEYVDRLEAAEFRLQIALDEIVKLQSPYAQLLNQYDGGERMTFDSAEEWIKRLQTVKLA
jgi:hypothetical protein